MESRTRLVLFALAFIGLSAASAAATMQDQNSVIMEMFSRINDSARAQAAKKEWQKIPSPEVECVNVAVDVQTDSSLEDLINKGLTPSHNGLANVFTACRQIINRFPISSDQPCVLNDESGNPVSTRCDKMFFKDHGGTPMPISRETAYRMLFSGQGDAVKHGEVENEAAKQARLQPAQKTALADEHAVAPPPQESAPDGAPAKTQAASAASSAVSSPPDKNDGISDEDLLRDYMPDMTFAYAKHFMHALGKRDSYMHLCSGQRSSLYKNKAQSVLASGAFNSGQRDNLKKYYESGYKVGSAKLPYTDMCAPERRKRATEAFIRDLDTARGEPPKSAQPETLAATAGNQPAGASVLEADMVRMANYAVADSKIGSLSSRLGYRIAYQEYCDGSRSDFYTTWAKQVLAAASRTDQEMKGSLRAIEQFYDKGKWGLSRMKASDPNPCTEPMRSRNDASFQRSLDDNRRK